MKKENDKKKKKKIIKKLTKMSGKPPCKVTN